MTHVFISYVEEDSNVAIALADMIERGGHLAWYYQRDSIAGESYLAQMSRALDDAWAVLFVISRASLRSPMQVTKELELAHEDGTPVIPLLLDVAHQEFQREQPSWRTAIGTTVFMPIGRRDVSACEEALLKALANVQQLAAGTNGASDVPVFALMGTKGGAGKSTISSAVAELMAWQGANVLLIDADLEAFGLTRYLKASATSRPKVLSVADMAFAQHDSQGGREAEPRRRADGASAWRVTPKYLQQHRQGTQPFGSLFLVPGQLEDDPRVAYNAMANIQPESRRNAAALHVMRQCVELGRRLGVTISAVVIDCGAEQNPLVSAAIAVADYAFIVSSPHPEFRTRIGRYDAMHRGRYPEQSLPAMTVVVNQATPETEAGWIGTSNVHFVKEDATYRKNAADGKIDFEGVGPDNFFLDVLAILRSVFGPRHQALLPDPAEVWLEPFLRKLEGFPDTLLKAWQYRFLKTSVLVALLVAMAIGAGSWFSYQRAPTATFREPIVKAEGESQAAFESALGQIALPEPLRSRARISGSELQVVGNLSDPDSSLLLQACKHSGCVAAVGAIRKASNEAASGQVMLLTLGLVIAGVVLGFSLVRARVLAQRRDLLRVIRGACRTDDKVALRELLHRLLDEEKEDPKLAWLRTQFREWYLLGRYLQKANG